MQLNDYNKFNIDLQLNEEKLGAKQFTNSNTIVIAVFGQQHGFLSIMHMLFVWIGE